MPFSLRLFNNIKRGHAENFTKGDLIEIKLFDNESYFILIL